MAIEPARLWADLQMDEPTEEKTHVRGARACTAARARVSGALRPVARAQDLMRGSEHFEAIEHCESLFARGEWFLGNGQPDLAQTFFAEANRALKVIISNLTANLGERIEPVVIAGRWDEINTLTPGQYRRGGAIVSAFGGRRGRARVF